MSSYDPKKIEEYQLILLKNPRSKVFAALAEAYRKMGMIDEAAEVAEKGVERNPDYPSGRVSYARVLVDQEKYAVAVQHLEKALEIRPENLLALRILAHCQFRTQSYQQALGTYKKLLFFNPNDETAQEFVKKWEFLEGVDYDFEHPLIEPQELQSWVESLPHFRDLLTVVDVFLTKEDFSGAGELLRNGVQRWPDSKEVLNRWNFVKEKLPGYAEREHKKAFWQHWLQRIEQRKSIDPIGL